MPTSEAEIRKGIEVVQKWSEESERFGVFLALLRAAEVINQSVLGLAWRCFLSAEVRGCIRIGKTMRFVTRSRDQSMQGAGSRQLGGSGARCTVK